MCCHSLGKNKGNVISISGSPSVFSIYLSIFEHRIVVLIMDVCVFHRMKRKFYSWDECMNLREVKVSVVMLCRAAYRNFTPNIM